MALLSTWDDCEGIEHLNNSCSKNFKPKTWGDCITYLG